MAEDDVVGLIVVLVLISPGLLWVLVHFTISCVNGFSGQLAAGRSDGPVGDEPAYKQYFFRRAFLDLRDILIDGWQRITRPLKRITAQNVAIFLLLFCCCGFVFYPVIAAAVATVVLSALFALSFSAVITAMVALNFALMISVRGLELGFVRYFHFVNHCPACYHKFGLPVYQCSCGARHRRLLPGTYGIFHRRCECGRRLPTSYLFGRHRLEGYCPKCDCRLEGEDPTLRPVLLPVIAGRSAGKTTYQVALLMRLQERQVRGEIAFSFVSANDRLKYDAAVSMFQGGSLLPQTLERVPKALQLNFSIREKGEPVLGKLQGRRLRIQLFDAAGEAYQDEQDMAQLQFLRHCHGLIMLIDPLSIELVRQRFSGDLARRGSEVSPSDANPEDVYDRLLEFLERHGVRTIGKKVSFPLAVVVTKRDAFGLPAELGRAALERWQRVANQQAAKKGQPASRVDPSWVVRKWLRDQQHVGLVEKIESQFQFFRYFSCSVFGRPPSQLAGRPFEPDGVEAPFAWLLLVSKICEPVR